VPLMIFICQTAHAAKWVAEVGMHTGGDEFVNATNPNGNTYSSKAGELMTLAIGPQLTISDNSNLRVLFAWKFNSMGSMHGSSDNIDFTRFPIDVMYFYRFKRWNFGGGLSYHINPELSGDGNNINYENALGYVVEFDFRFMKSFYVGGKYTAIDYKHENNSTTIDGNSIGVVMGFVFGG